MTIENAIADGSAPTEDDALLRPLGARCDDPFCNSRNLASIMLAALEQAKGKQFKAIEARFAEGPGPRK